MLSRTDTMSSDESQERLEPPFVLALSSAQRQLLRELRAWCVENGVYWRVHNGIKVNDDATLLRYLKARNWQVPAAAKQYASTVAWRRKIDLDHLYENVGIDEFEAVSRLMPQWTGRRTRDGVPLFVYSVAKTRPEDLLTTSKADPSLSNVFLPAEYSTRFVQPVCAALHPQASMPVLAHIIDLHGVGVRHFWSLRSHLQKAASMATNHYPESVDKIFIVGAPSFFPTIWNYITKWFDAAITSKISVLSADKMREVLFQHIEPSNLPQAFGGELEWEYGMAPNFDADVQSLLLATGEEWVKGPVLIDITPSESMVSSTSSVLAIGREKDNRPRRLLLTTLATPSCCSVEA